MPGAAGQQLPQASAQFLNTVLSQGGPQALPYSEDVKWSIRQHLLAVVQEFPGLQVRTATFTHNDGRAINLLQCEGTVPMYYQGVKYNIPVTIWLLENYPRTCPLVYVTPTRDMIIKPRHPNVDASGLVDVPYLREWIYPRSTLVDLVHKCSELFSLEPPLFSRSQSGRPSYSSSSSGTPPTSQGARPDPISVFRRNAINALSDRLQKDIVIHSKEVTRDMDQFFNTQALLYQRAEILDRGVRELQSEKEALEQTLQLMLTNTDVVETWLNVNDKGPVEVDIDTAFVPVDALSKQMLDCTAQDLAIEDILYSLDKGVQDGIIPVEIYLRHVRNLAREQFMHRATSLKVRAAQMHGQVAAMAAQASSLTQPHDSCPSPLLSWSSSAY